MLNIKYDIVGSFLRPQEIKEARAEFNNNEITYFPDHRQNGKEQT